MDNRKYFRLISCILFLFLFVSIPGTLFSKDSIRIGASRSITGPLGLWEISGFGPIYKMWVKEVNEKGGIFVKEFNKKLPIDLIVHDDKSDMGIMARQIEKLITKDKVDFILPPTSTAFLFAAAAVTNRYKYLLIGAEGGATSIEDNLSKWPYFFAVLNYSDWNQMPVLAEIFYQQKVKTVAVLYIDDLHGIEYKESSAKEFKKNGIKIKLSKGVSPNTKDVSAIIKEAKRLNVDAFISFTYPPLSFFVLQQAMENNINFKAFVIGPGSSFSSFRNMFGKEAVEGVIGEGAWNAKSSKEAGEFVNKYLKDNKEETLDWWGNLPYYAGLQVLEQAIVKAGTLNHKEIKKVIAKHKFNTVLGVTYFTMFKDGGGLLAKECFAGQIGQWQNGVFEVIDAGKKRTADPIYPKPIWPIVKKAQE